MNIFVFQNYCNNDNMGIKKKKSNNLNNKQLTCESHTITKKKKQNALMRRWEMGKSTMNKRQVVEWDL